jgi:hypothetical protein
MGGPVQYEALSPECMVVARFVAEPSTQSGFEGEAYLERPLIWILLAAGCAINLRCLTDPCRPCDRSLKR